MAALNEKQAKLLLEKNFATVATIRPDGTPHLSPVWIDWDGENVVFNTAIGRAKERHLRRDPRVAVEVTDPSNPYNYLAVTGTAELSVDGADAHIDKLAKKYLGVDSYPYRTPAERRIIVRIQPERVEGQID